MSITAPPTISTLPTPPNPNDRSTFDSRAYTWSVALDGHSDQIEAVASNVYNNALETQTNTQSALTYKNSAEASKVSAEQAATAAEQAASSIKWVTGTNYTEGSVVWSPITFLNYRKKTTGISSTDPSLDSDWQALNQINLSTTGLPITVTSSIISTSIPGSHVLIDVLEISSSKRVLIFGGGQGSSWAYSAVAFDITTRTFGSPVVFNTHTNTCDIAASVVDSTNVLVFCKNTGSTASKAIVLTVSGNSISVGTPVLKTLSTTNALFSKMINLGGTFVVAGQGYILPITVSGTTPTIGSETAPSGSPVVYDVVKVSSSVFFIYGFRSGNTLAVIPYSCSGLTLTLGSETTSACTSAPFYRPTEYSSGVFLATYVNTQVYGAVITITGSSASISTVQLGAGAYTANTYVKINNALAVRTGANSFNILGNSSGTAVARVEITGVNMPTESGWIVGYGSNWLATSNYSSTNPSIDVYDVVSNPYKKYTAGAAMHELACTPSVLADSTLAVAAVSKSFVLRSQASTTSSNYYAVFSNTGELETIASNDKVHITGNVRIRESNNTTYWAGSSSGANIVISKIEV